MAKPKHNAITEIKALQSGVLGTFTGVSIVHTEPKPVTINRAMRRKGAK